MKASELSSITLKISKILKVYGETEIEDVLDDILQLVENNRKENNKNIITKEELPFETQMIIENLKNMRISEIEMYLSNQPKKILLEIADQLYISTNSRQTIKNLIYSISKYFERNKIDHMIRVDRHE
ncbi:hypothetical protein [Lysinibacillus sp. FSL K6-4013]|uniref:hypothetical protein n=1 Tax=Lysinibacillus sp. FSL K6-4013 TaxID=2921504 RepID=UPI00315A6852